VRKKFLDTYLNAAYDRAKLDQTPAAAVGTRPGTQGVGMGGNRPAREGDSDEMKG